MRDLVEQVLFTAPGERVNRPTFGSGVLQLVFAPEQRRARDRDPVPGAGRAAAVARRLVEVQASTWPARTRRCGWRSQYIGPRATGQPRRSPSSRGRCDRDATSTAARRAAAARWRRAAPTATLNGIDYLEVDAGHRRRRRRSARCWSAACCRCRPASARRDVRIDGGVRATGQPVRGVGGPAAAPTSAAAGAGHRHDVRRVRRAARPDRLLVVRTTPPATSPPTGSSSSTRRRADFDPRLAEVDFSFKVDCPSDFDCRPRTSARRERAGRAGHRLPGRDYAGFRQLLLDRLSLVHAALDATATPPTSASRWWSCSPTSATTCATAQDAVADRGLLGTARRRVSVRRHARLLDYPMHEGCNARAWLVLAVDATVPPGPRTGAAHRRRAAGRRCSRGAARCARRTALVFHTLHPVDPARRAQRDRPSTPGATQRCCLPRGATRGDAARHGAAAALAPGDVLVFEEVLGAEPAASADADPTHRHGRCG